MNYKQNIQDSVSVKDTLAIKPEDLRLQPLYGPDPVPFTMETIGWKILPIILIAISLIILYFVIKHHRKNAYRREALKNLEGVHSTSEIMVILKMVAIHAFGRETAGTLYGEQWISFLDEKVKKPLFTPYKNNLVEMVYYDKEPPNEIRQKILLNSKKWIKTHA
ncbi:DUF4381 domain-containing protein [Galbibacter sp. BG1]|uniref:DUF4381 domain-containing protein n=1 Tax=Galbibacter sp. BG1 TaxID=1170699 RepID=UPI0015BEFBBF|nr:DUF4381 domain-containing protein [Galbibacter sp. BG1]QLE00191.1 DUF4381 domain-containing protein [Galbibacter sp. BG1]